MSYDPNTDDAWKIVISILAILGLIGSYWPQYRRIIKERSSEGLSPWFLFFGCISYTGVMCSVLAFQKSHEYDVGHGSLGPVPQVTTHWLLFTIFAVLYIIYFPKNLKYVDIITHAESTSGVVQVRQRGVKSAEWNLVLKLSCLVLIHFVSVCWATVDIIHGPRGFLNPADFWGLFLGVISPCFTIAQYTMQLRATWKAGRVGALSVPMMYAQCPATILFVFSIMVQPGTFAIDLVTYGIAGILQVALLLICVRCTSQQKRLGIDDFGRPLASDTEHQVVPNIEAERGELAPLLRNPVAARLPSVHDLDINL